MTERVTYKHNTHGAATTPEQEQRNLERAMAMSAAAGASSQEENNIQAAIAASMATSAPRSSSAASGSSSAAAGSSSAAAGASSAAVPSGVSEEIARLTPVDFLTRFPTPPDVQSQARDILGVYTPGNYFEKVQEFAALNESNVSISVILPPSQGRGGLYHGSATAAADGATIQRHNIRLIIQAAADSGPKQMIRDALARMDDTYRPLILELDMTDDENQPLESLLNKRLSNEFYGNLRLLDLMRTVRQEGGGVLVNCRVGISRSTAIILMYLIDPAGDNMTLLDAWRFLKMKRPEIFPNFGFVRKLQQYERRIRTRDPRALIKEELLRLYPGYEPMHGGYRKIRRSKKTRKSRRRSTKKSRRR